MAGPLTGVRVIDCSRGVAGGRVTGLLADYGADVIWIEPPGGDPFREECEVEYSVFNRGKRSVVLDLRDDSARSTLLDLVERSDVFVQSWSPGVAERLGVGYDELHARAPGTVYCSISGFGLDDANRDAPGYEAIVHALLGTMAEQVGHRDPPIYEALPFASIGAGYVGALGILAALLRRDLDGVGRHVETSLVDGALAYLSMGWGDADVGMAPLEVGLFRLIAGTFRCADDEYLGVHTGAVGAFGRLMVVLGLDDRIPPSADGMDLGVPLTPEQKTVLDGEIHGIFASEPRATWIKRLLDADICAIPLLRPGEIFDEPQVAHNEMVVVVDDPELGPIEQVGIPAKLAATPGEVRRPAPRVDDGGAALVAEVLSESPRSGGPVGPVDDRPLLDGVKVLDLGAYFAGPFSSRLLADLGADVVKLEPVLGDPLRGLERPFRAASAGKRSIVANLKDPDLARARDELVRWADIVHHNMRPGVAERLGLGYEQVRALNPSAIYVYAPGWGSSGPDRDRQSFAPLLSGFVGAGFEVAGQFNPPLFPVGNEDPGNGLVGAVAMLMALWHRRRGGAGQYIENPQLNATMTHVAHIVRREDGVVLNANRLDPVQLGFGALDRLYETADGWLCLVAVTDAHVRSLGEVIGVDLLGDERFASRAARAANDDALAHILGGAFAGRPAAEWVAVLSAVGVPAAQPVPYNNVAFMHDPAQRRLGRVAEFPHPTQGRVRELANFVRISDAAVVPHRLAPTLGDGTDDVLAACGYSPAEIADLRARGSVR